MTGLEVTMASSHTIVLNPFTITHIKVKAKQLCKRSNYCSSDFEDLRQGMQQYLLEKAHLFDPNRGNLEAFVTHTIQTWIAMQLRYHKYIKRNDSNKALSLERTQLEYEGDINTLSQVLLEDDGRRRTQVYPKSDLEQLELREAVARVMAKLDPDDRDLVNSLVEHGVKATARMRGMSWRQVANTRDRLQEIFTISGLFPK